MKNMKIRTSIALSLFLPILGLVLFSGYVLLDLRQTASEMKHLNEIARLAPVISNLAQELQKERGLAAMYIGSKGKKFKTELPAQFPNTESKLSELVMALQQFDSEAFKVLSPEEQAAADEARKAQAEANKEAGAEQNDEIAKTPRDLLVGHMQAALDSLKGIDKFRGKVLKRRNTVLRVSKYYTTVIQNLMSVIQDMSAISSNAEVTKAITAYSNFLQAKELAGVERDLGSAEFIKGRSFRFLNHKNFVELIAQQELLLKGFEVNATDSQKAFFKNTMVGDSIMEVNDMRVVAIASIQPEFNLNGRTADEWFKNSSQRIDLLRAVEDQIASDFVALLTGIQDAAQQAFFSMLILTLALLGVTLVFVVVIVRGITRPIANLTSDMITLSKGELDFENAAKGRTNEIGQMADSVEVFRERELEMRQMAADRQASREKAEEEKRQMMTTMADDFEASVGGVVKGVSAAATEMHASAESLTNTADKTSSQSGIVAKASEHAMQNVQTVASAAEQLSCSIQEISSQVAQSTNIAGTAVSEVEATNQKIQGLADAANKIGEVVAMITDIADQTNLLALNATIEAARAGDAGKGFAVVASEVKNLANQTAKATEEISAQISGIQGATQTAVEAIGNIGQTIHQLSEISASIAAAVEEQGAATSEIARTIEQAAGDTTEVSTNISGVTQAADETGNSANQMLSSSNELSKQAEALNTQVSQFLNQVRNG